MNSFKVENVQRNIRRCEWSIRAAFCRCEVCEAAFLHASLILIKLVSRYDSVAQVMSTAAKAGLLRIGFVSDPGGQ